MEHPDKDGGRENHPCARGHSRTCLLMVLDPKQSHAWKLHLAEEQHHGSGAVRTPRAAPTAMPGPSHGVYSQPPLQGVEG